MTMRMILMTSQITTVVTQLPHTTMLSTLKLDQVLNMTMKMILMTCLIAAILFLNAITLSQWVQCHKPKSLLVCTRSKDSKYKLTGKCISCQNFKSLMSSSHTRKTPMMLPLILQMMITILLTLLSGMRRSMQKLYLLQANYKQRRMLIKLPLNLLLKMKQKERHIKQMKFKNDNKKRKKVEDKRKSNKPFSRRLRSIKKHNLLVVPRFMALGKVISVLLRVKIAISITLTNGTRL